MVSIIIIDKIDFSPLENYHIAETFKVLMQKEYNILSNFNSSEFRIIRKRIIEVVLATDMTNHSRNLSSLKNKLSYAEINNGENVSKIILDEDNSITFENQQLVLNNILHTADISNPAKLSYIYNQWVNYVFEEFFNQGDLEMKANLSISMLCDRKTTDITKSQIGFIKFVVKPSFDCLMLIAPEIKTYNDYINKNLKMYEDKAKSSEI